MKDFNDNNPPQSGKNGGSRAYLTEMIVKAFSGKSEGQIWRNIIAQAEQGKRDGTLTNKDLDDFYAAASPMLDGFGRQKLRKVIERLKSI